MANVFISHRKADDREAERLAQTIRSSGHRVWFDEWEIDLGDSITERMQEGLAGANYLVLCLSSSGVTSPWMGREWYATLARQLNGQGIKILPVRLTGGDLPEIIADLKYADLVKDWQSGVMTLLKAIK